MPLNPERAEAIFTAALAQPSIAERVSFVKGACRDEPELLARVESLLQAHDGLGSFLAPSTRQAQTLDVIHESPGTRIGRYKLLQLIGEGGFGSVFMAEQEEPVRRRVALKIVKLGMDTRQVIARFEAERQALALMDHPNIAKVFDAGATETGRPFFVMELVKGVPITEYCDKNNLSTRERLALFVAVCNAVQHAHQKGVIHRDIKPSNVLVTLHDGKPVPKVIDFGIAKATSQRLTEKTVFTEYKQFIGTPAYTSPEQAEMSGLDVDTRSDIYSLGVLLYELLTGATPFDPSKLREAAYVEIQRIIREVEPPRPSVRLSTMGEALTVAAKHRSVDPAQLSKQVRGDLDWIVMKCLEKDRTRRYETANGLAMDVTRHLGNEAVVARPASVVYRMQKFARRHKAAFAASILLATTILLGVIGTSVGFVRARSALAVAEDQKNSARKEAERATKAEQLASQRQQETEREAARATAVNEFMTGIFSAPNPNKPGGRDVKVADLLDAAGAQIEQRFNDQAGLEIETRYTLATSYHWLGLGKEAVDHLRAAYLLALKLPKNESESAIVKIGPDLSFYLGELGQYAEAKHIATDSYEMAVRLTGPGSHATVRSANNLANMLRAEGKDAEAENLYRKHLKWAEDHPGQVPAADHANLLTNLAIMKKLEGKLGEAEILGREALAVGEGGSANINDRAWMRGTTLAHFLMEQEKYPEVEQIYKQLVPELQQKLGSADIVTLSAMCDYANALLQTGHYPELLAVRRKIADALSRANSNSSGDQAMALYSLADAYSLNGQEAEAAPRIKDALALQHRAGASSDIIKALWRTAVLRTGLGSTTAWKCESLRAQLWCALDQFLQDEPPPDDQLDDLQWDSLKCIVQRWVPTPDGPSHAVTLAQGGLSELRAVSDLDDGEYLLSLDARRARRAPMHTVAWITPSHWKASLYPADRWGVASFQTPLGWRETKAQPAAVHRSFPGMALASILSRDAGPGGREYRFALVATTTINLPAGEYRLVVTSDDGVRVDLDGRRVIDSWTPRPPSTDEAMSIRLDGAAHALRVEYFQNTGEFKLWVQFEPLAPEAVAMMPDGPRPSTFTKRLQALTEGIQKNPTIVLLMNRGHLYASYGRFHEAADDYDAAMNMFPTAYEHGWLAAYAHARAGDEQGYVKCCRELADRFADTSNDLVRERLSKAFALLPGAIGTTLLLHMVDIPARPSQDSSFGSWVALAKGIVYYRAGHWQEAADSLSSSLAPDVGPVAQVAAFYFLAMAHRQLNQTDKANDFLNRARQLDDSEIAPRSGLGNLGDPNWTDWIYVQEARKEALALLKPPAQSGNRNGDTAASGDK